MKILYFLLPITIFCSCVSHSDYDKAINKIDSLSTLNIQQTATIRQIRDSIIMLSYSAKDRMTNIKTLIKKDKFDDAKKEIAILKSLFPNSSEIKNCLIQEKIIQSKIQKKIDEENRIKALGFKAFRDHSVAKYNHFKIKINNFKTAREYRFDYCNDINRFWFRTADKDNIYLLAQMLVTCTEKQDVEIPRISAYSIEGGKLIKCSNLNYEYSSWSSYGAKLGNHEDTSHDFNKVNSIKYNLGAEISKEDSKKALLILAHNNEFEESADTLNINQIRKDYTVIKIWNRHKIK